MNSISEQPTLPSMPSELPCAPEVARPQQSDASSAAENLSFPSLAEIEQYLASAEGQEYARYVAMSAFGSQPIGATLYDTLAMPPLGVDGADLAIGGNASNSAHPEGSNTVSANSISHTTYQAELAAMPAGSASLIPDFSSLALTEPDLRLLWSFDFTGTTGEDSSTLLSPAGEQAQSYMPTTFYDPSLWNTLSALGGVQQSSEPTGQDSITLPAKVHVGGMPWNPPPTSVNFTPLPSSSGSESDVPAPHHQLHLPVPATALIPSTPSPLRAKSTQKKTKKTRLSPYARALEQGQTRPTAKRRSLDSTSSSPSTSSSHKRRTASSSPDSDASFGPNKSSSSSKLGPKSSWKMTWSIEEVSRRLIELGADPNVPNWDNICAAHVGVNVNMTRSYGVEIDLWHWFIEATYAGQLIRRGEIPIRAEAAYRRAVAERRAVPLSDPSSSSSSEGEEVKAVSKKAFEGSWLDGVRKRHGIVNTWVTIPPSELTASPSDYEGDSESEGEKKKKVKGRKESGVNRAWIKFLRDYHPHIVEYSGLRLPEHLLQLTPATAPVHTHAQA